MTDPQEAASRRAAAQAEDDLRVAHLKQLIRESVPFKRREVVAALPPRDVEEIARAVLPLLAAEVQRAVDVEREACAEICAMKARELEPDGPEPANLGRTAIRSWLLGAAVEIRARQRAGG